MTSPLQPTPPTPRPGSAWNLVDETDEKDALADISRMMTGAKILQDEPGVVYSLASIKANPADAGAVDQFMQALDAEKQVTVARAAGEYINLTPEQQQLLNQDGTNYSDVLYTPKRGADAAAAQVEDASQGQMTVKRNEDGTLALDVNGNIQTEATHKSGGGWFSGVGDFFSHLGGAIKTGAVDTLHGIQKGLNFVQAGLAGHGFHNPLDTSYNVGGSNWEKASQAAVQDMQDQGYDPNSFWSTAAFYASGKKHTDLSGLNDQYGADKVDEALKFLNDPKAYRESIEQDPNNFVKDANGQTSLTPEAAAKLSYLNSQDFTDLAKKINANQATLGNDLANALGIDPIKHSTTYAATAATANIAASFVIDPTLIGLKGIQVAKFSQVGIKTLADQDKAAEILLRQSRLPWVNNVQRGWQRAIDLGSDMRAAHAAGDDVQLAKLTAQFNAELPSLAPMMPEFVGVNAATGYRQILDPETGKLVTEVTRGNTGGIQSLEQAADFVRSNVGLNLLRSGRAATQASLMPGALSAVGYRRFKGAVAGWMTARSATRAENAYRSVISQAEADPLLGEKLVDEGVLMRLPAQADDAVDSATGQAIAQPVSTSGLASAARGDKYALTYEGKGGVTRALRGGDTGTALDETVGRNIFRPGAIAARSRMAAQRLSTLLPRNTSISIDDVQNDGDKIYKYALTYLNRGDAQALRAAWNFGGDAERKAIIGGLWDQIGHAAGLGQTETGAKLLDSARTELESYSAAGNEIELDGQRLALFNGQTRRDWTLPSFQRVQQSAAKIGLWESTFGRALTSSQADMLGSLWKVPLLLRPATITRNMLEGWSRAALDGKMGDAIAAKAVASARNKDLWKLGYGNDDLEAFRAARGQVEGLQKMLDSGGLSAEQRANAYAQKAEAQRVIDTLSDKPIVQHLKATEAGDTELAKQIEGGSLLAGETLGRMPLTAKLADLAPLALAGRAYSGLFLRHMDPERVEALLTLSPEELQQVAEGYGRQTLEAHFGFKNAARESTEIAKAGLGPSKWRFTLHQSLSRKGQKASDEIVQWTHQALDGTIGSDRYATALHQRIVGMPLTAKAVLAHIDAPTPETFAEVVKALEAESKNTGFGKVFFEDPVNAPHVARRAVTDDEVLAGKQDWANKVVAEYKYLLTGQNDVYQRELADYIAERGEAPDAEWINEHLSGDNRPESALAPQVMAMSPGGLKGLPETLQDMSGAAFQFLVERELQRTTSMPVFLANYAEARAGLNDQVERLVEQGFTREAAENQAKELAVRNAMVKTEQIIDDPGQKAQFDVIARNMFPFARATQAMIRRWGTGLWQNPANARKLMLAYEGAVHSGLIYNNVYGEPTFTYPGSGVFNMLMRGIAKLPGFSDVAAFPVSSDMTGSVLMSVPGADNPFRMSMGPMISIPLREVYKHLLPTAYQGEALKLDSLVNGPIGAGETFSQLVPPSVRKFYQAFSGEDRNSALTSAMNGAFANLAAAGLIPPTDASPADFQMFRSRLQAQVKSQLFLRAVFGLFAPAAPSSPTEGTSASGADYAWQLDGIKQLSDEYKAILNEVGGDVGRANAVFTAMHPDRVVYSDKGNITELPAAAYETSRSGASASGAYLPSTDSALAWMTQNADFIHKYSSVAAYFLPNATTGEPFSDAAYQAQLELGLRLRKTPTEFMNDVYVKHAESQFYPAVAQFDALIASAKASGDTSTENQWTQAKSNWEKEYKALNPLFGAKQDDYGTARATAVGQLADLTKMVNENAVPDGQATALRQLITAYEGYQAFIRQYPGQDQASRTARDNALHMFNTWAQERLTGSPIADVFNGVFRVLNSNFDKVS